MNFCRRAHRGVLTHILSRITDLVSQDDLQAVIDIMQNVESGICESLKMWGNVLRIYLQVLR